MAADPHGTPGETMAYVFVLLPALAVAWAIWTFNRLVRLRNQTRTAWADIDVQLTRRHDLVPMLVESVKAYAGHEKALLENVAALRAQAMTLKSPQQLGQVESQLEQGLGRLFMLKEAYPDLKANQNFLKLQEELTATENRIGFARQHYNDVVGQYNASLMRFPANILGNLFGFRQVEFFQLDAAEAAAVREAPQVKF